MTCDPESDHILFGLWEHCGSGKHAFSNWIDDDWQVNARMAEMVVSRLLTAAVADVAVSVRRQVLRAFERTVSLDPYLAQADRLASSLLALSTTYLFKRNTKLTGNPKNLRVCRLHRCQQHRNAPFS